MALNEKEIWKRERNTTQSPYFLVIVRLEFTNFRHVMTDSEEWIKEILLASLHLIYLFKTRFLSLSTIDIFVAGGCPVHYRRPQPTTCPWHPLPPFGTTTNASRLCQMSPGGKIALVEKQLPVTVLDAEQIKMQKTYTWPCGVHSSAVLLQLHHAASHREGLLKLRLLTTAWE